VLIDRSYSRKERQMIVDKPLSELEQYRPALTRADDFDTFWASTVAESNDQPLNAVAEVYPFPNERVTVYRVRYDGFGEHTRIAGWYIVPKEPYRLSVDGKIPAIIHYHGYSGSKGLPVRHIAWALQGYCVFAVDTRGQSGETPDNHIYESGNVLGCMTKGIADPATYFYRYAYMDCVRAVDFIRTRPEVGPIIVSGASQGGALTLAVTALAQDKGIVAAMPDVPYLCHFRRAVEMFSVGPYEELVSFWQKNPYAVEQGYHTLSYFDGMNMAPRINRPTLLSIALLDPLCPPSTGFAVYNHLTCVKTLKIYPYNQHEGGGDYQETEKWSFAQSILLNHNK
jgi:cephalosporin-C deacetylase